ncbi:MAG: hypothetical protein WAW07_10300 [Bacteroidales bacterium]
MKKDLILSLFFVLLISCNQSPQPVTGLNDSGILSVDSAEVTNDFYDNTETIRLPLPEVSIVGEIANPGKVDFSTLSRHSVIVKETLLDQDGRDRFVGAYRYDGYSLFDILKNAVVQKTNEEEFNSVIDLFVEVENAAGEKAVFSWGEIYYPNNLHRILIADRVSRIVPSKTNDLWTLPSESRIVAGNDLITERNISSPVKITVRSLPLSFAVTKGMSPMYSKQISLIIDGSPAGDITGFPAGAGVVTYNTIFYGRGKGIHSTEPFSGVMLKDVLGPFFPLNRENLRSGIMCIAAGDGYRSTASFSEIFNRNDQQELLLVKTKPDEDGGLFRIFPACDFFSDRAIKSVKEIHLGF